MSKECRRTSAAEASQSTRGSVAAGTCDWPAAGSRALSSSAHALSPTHVGSGDWLSKHLSGVGVEIATAPRGGPGRQGRGDAGSEARRGGLRARCGRGRGRRMEWSWFHMFPGSPEAILPPFLSIATTPAFATPPLAPDPHLPTAPVVPHSPDASDDAPAPRPRYLCRTFCARGPHLTSLRSALLALAFPARLSSHPPPSAAHL